MTDATRKEGFRTDLKHLINCYNMEAGSNTPDFILAEYLSEQLALFDQITAMRKAWYD